MRKFSAIEKTSGWSTIYKQTIDLLGKTKTDGIFNQAFDLTEKYEKDYQRCRGIHRMHVMSAIAIGSLYLSLKEQLGSENAARMLEEAEKPTAIANHNKIERFPAVCLFFYKKRLLRHLVIS